MDLQLKNKRAFVSGSTGGIGLAIAKVLASEGAEVIINGRSQDRIDQAITWLKSEVPGAKLSGIPADFADSASVESLLAKLGSVDILINNVGIFTSQSFADTSDVDWYQMFEVNVMSGVRLSRAVLPGMLERNWGRILFVSSECALLVPEDLIAYSTTKAALLAVSRGLAHTTKGSAVTVNSVLPGSTLSEGAERFLKTVAENEQISEKEVAENFFKNVRTSSLIQRFTSTEEIANTIAYLCSPLSSATNGAAIKLEGGSVSGIL
jgi:NAD(P)-dependent dehydrogenase (short-subunit alcohol dehydrogenase family)